MDNSNEALRGKPVIWIDPSRADWGREVVWIGLTKDDVRGVLEEGGDLYTQDALDIVRERLTEMVEDGTLEIDRDYTVTGTAIMDVTMTHTVQARSVETARQAFYEAVQDIGPENMDDYEVTEVRDEDILDVSLD
tara:strand:- start:1825 stop:2229 length:405 start_codon:yes stop_codon:yes gene_type:complete